MENIYGSFSYSCSDNMNQDREAFKNAEAFTGIKHPSDRLNVRGSIFYGRKGKDEYFLTCPLFFHYVPFNFNVRNSIPQLIICGKDLQCAGLNFIQ